LTGRHILIIKASRGAILADETTWLTIEDIYELLDKKVPKDTIRSWIRTKRLPAYKPARAILVKREDLDKFIQDSRTKPEDD
jgi:excisionase family DNA binding protein